MTTQEAFTELVNSPYLWKRTGQSTTTRRSYKHRLAQGTWPSLDKMEELLLITENFTPIQEKSWVLK